MGFWSSLKGQVGAQFLDVIQWQEQGNDTLVYRPPVFDQVIQDGGKLVVREGQSAVFQKEGQISDAFGPGTYELSTRTPAIWGFFQSIKYGLNNPYKGDVFFLNTRIMRDQKWGSPGPFPLRDKKFGLIKLRAFGTYSFRIADTVKFIREVVGNNGLFSADEINGDIKRRLFDKFKILAKAGGVSYEELDMQTDEIRAALVQRLGGELLADYGIQLTGFTILNVNVDPEDEKRIRRVEDIDVFDSRFDRYREMRQMDMMDSAVTREGSSNQMMDAGMGLAMGQMFGGMMGQQQMGGQPQQTGTTPGDTTETPVLTLYGPNGEIRTFNLPLSEADAAEVKRLKEELGYSETKAVTPTPTPTGSDRGERTKLETDPYSWMKDYDYKNLDTLKNQTITNLTKDPVPGARGLLQNIQTAAESAGHIIVLANNGASKEEVDSMVQQYEQFIKDAKLNLVPKGLLNGDKFAKDIAAKNRDIALFKKSTDPFGNPIFKDDNAFNKFMQKVAPEGMTYDPTEERTVAALGEGDISTTAKGVYKRTKPVSETLKSSPRPVARPTRPVDKTPIAIPTGRESVPVSSLPETRSQLSVAPKSAEDARNEARKAAAARRKKKDRTSKAAKESAKKSLKKAGFKPGTYKGGRAEGGLMKKGNK